MRRISSFLRRQKRNIALAIFVALFLTYVVTGETNDELHKAYDKEISVRILDRAGNLLAILPNGKGAYMKEAASAVRTAELAVKSEDKYFFYHPGVNPWSMLRSLFHFTVYREHVGGSTITQQLVKNLLHHENDRTIRNKLSEIYSAISLELHTGKSEILSMYLSSAYFGEQSEGIEVASETYFGKNSGSLSDSEIVRLLALLASPREKPGTPGNTLRARVIAKRVGVGEIGVFQNIPRALRGEKKSPAIFELTTLTHCTKTCTLSVDRNLTERIREIVRTNLNSPKFASVKNATVVVIKIGKDGAPNTLLSLVGTSDPYKTTGGSQMNMALAPRPIGSTWKPFIYGKAIERGARPYTLIDDAEYRYEIGTGYAFYPKNYDGIYRGPVTLNYALSNSLNVPAVRALQFVTIDKFSSFMEHDLGFIPRQSFDTYQLSVALGGLEMNPLLLAQYFTVFPREGILAPLKISREQSLDIPMLKPTSGVARIFTATTTQLMNRMLSDRLMGVEQFGLESNLNLPFQQYAVKTGTTYDYHDSWTVGYTPDIVVVAWIGNSDNKAMDLLTGARGAGKIWHDTMALLYAEGEIVPQKFDSSALVEVQTQEGNSFGLFGDDVARARTLMRSQQMILEPHDGDVLQFAKGMSVPLRSLSPVTWTEGGEILGSGTELFWEPSAPGTYTLNAKQENGAEKTLRIQIVEE